MQLSGATNPASTSSVRCWYVLLLMSITYTLSVTDRFMITQVLEPIRLELHLSSAGVGWLTGPTLAAFYIVLGFPISWLIDRGNRRNIISFSLIAWSVMTMCTGLSQGYWQLLAARIGVGIGEAGGTPGANSLLADIFPVGRRPMALTIFSLANPIGAYLASDTTGAIADLQGWRAPFLWLGAPGIAIGLLIWLTVAEPRRGSYDLRVGQAGSGFVESMRYLWRQRSAVHIIIASALTSLWGWGLMYWTPAYLMRTFSITTGQAGAVTGKVHLIGGIAATIFTSWLMTRKCMANPRKIAALLGCCIAVGTVVSGVIYASHSLRLAQILFWAFIPTIHFWIGPCFGMLLNLAEPRMRAQFCAAWLFLSNFFNLFLAPLGVGALDDIFGGVSGPNAGSLRIAMLCLVPAGLWAAVHYFLSMRTIAEDQERATGVSVPS